MGCLLLCCFKISLCPLVGWVRWGKIKCGAKALAFLSFFIGLSMFVGCLLALGITCRRFTKLRIFNTFDYKYRQNLVSKITNSDKSPTPQFRETAVGSSFLFLVKMKSHNFYFYFLFFILWKSEFICK